MYDRVFIKYTCVLYISIYKYICLLYVVSPLKLINFCISLVLNCTHGCCD